MIYEYDVETDILMIRLRKGKPDHGEMEGNVITHYSKDGKIVELEIMDATRETANLFLSMMKSKKSAAADSD